MTHAAWLGILVWLSGAPMMLWPDHAVVFAQQQPSQQVVTGTLVKLDLADMKGLVRTDLGKPIFFQVVNPHLFEKLSVGDRVTVVLDPYGRLNKVTDASIAEFVVPETGDPSTTDAPQIG